MFLLSPGNNLLGQAGCVSAISILAECKVACPASRHATFLLMTLELGCFSECEMHCVFLRYFKLCTSEEPPLVKTPNSSGGAFALQESGAVKFVATTRRAYFPLPPGPAPVEFVDFVGGPFGGGAFDVDPPGVDAFPPVPPAVFPTVLLDVVFPV